MKQQKLSPTADTSAKSKKGKANEIDDYIGKKLLEFRGKYNLTQADVAAKLDVSTQQYQKYENGDNRLSLSKFLHLSRSIAFPLKDFVDGYIQESQRSIEMDLSDNAQASLSGVEAQYIETQKDTADLMKAYHSIEDNEKRKNFVKAVKEMAKALK